MAEVKDQAYDNEADKDSEASIYEGRWYAQTFTPSSDLELTKIGFYLKSYGDNYTYYFNIYETDINGHPTGTALVGGNGYADISKTEFTWIEKALAYPLLNQGQLYALELHHGTNNYTDRIEWGRDISDPTYPNGCQVVSSDSGSTWIAYPDKDMLFRIYGEPMAKGHSKGHIIG